MALMLRSTARSHVGRVRAGNEDSGYAGPRLLLVADGMGGHAAGEVASAATVRAMRSLDTADVDEPRSALRAAVFAANDQLRVLVRADPRREGMGTTLTALLWRGTGFTIAHVGDSRAYVLRGSELTQITHDHTFVQTLVDDGRISADEAESHPQRSLILRSVRGHGRLEIDIDDVDAQEGDRLLVCSDGLSSFVPVAEVARILANGAIEDAADRLIGAALDRGAPDNVTCVVAEVYDSDDTGVLPTSEPTGLLVGAATDAAAGGIGLAGAGDAATEQPDRRLHDPEDDEEELLRYAPRPPARFRWLRRVAVVTIAMAVLVGGAYAGLAWTRTQYYIGVDGDRVAIFQGLDQVVGGRSLSEVHEVLAVTVADLPTFDREQVARSIPASSLLDAQSIGARLEVRARSCERLRQGASPTGTDTEPTATPSDISTTTAGPGPSAGGTSTSTGTAGSADSRGTASATPTQSPTGGGTSTPGPTGTAPRPSDTADQSSTTTPTLEPTPEGTDPGTGESVEDQFDATVTAAECGLGAS